MSPIYRKEMKLNTYTTWAQRCFNWYAPFHPKAFYEHENNYFSNQQQNTQFKRKNLINKSLLYLFWRTQTFHKRSIISIQWCCEKYFQLIVSILDWNKFYKPEKKDKMAASNISETLKKIWKWYRFIRRYYVLQKPNHFAYLNKRLLRFFLFSLSLIR